MRVDWERRTQRAAGCGAIYRIQCRRSEARAMCSPGYKLAI
jgi:hypothetical protein